MTKSMPNYILEFCWHQFNFSLELVEIEIMLSSTFIFLKKLRLFVFLGIFLLSSCAKST